jgi:hypothetical protein
MGGHPTLKRESGHLPSIFVGKIVKITYKFWLEVNTFVALEKKGGGGVMGIGVWEEGEGGIVDVRHTINPCLI